MRTKSYLRYRDDVGMEYRCSTCRTYWPLTPDFWDMRSFVRCRACWRAYKNNKGRQYRSDEAVRRRHLAYQKEYRRSAAHAKKLASHDYYWTNPEVQREKALQYYQANRETILARKRERYWAAKAA